MMFESIIIIGTPFSGKTTLAKLLAEHFNWKFFSVGHLWKGLWKEKYPNGETSFENYWTQTTDDENKEMDKYVHEMVQEGHVVGDMRYAFLHRDPQVLIIFTKCDIDTRTKRALEINKYPGKDFAQVKEILEQRERDEVDRGKKLYGEDYRDEKNYDMAFDTSNSAPEEAIEQIMDLK